MATIKHATTGYWNTSCLVLVRDELIRATLQKLFEDCRMGTVTYVDDLDQAMLHLCSDARTDMVVCDAIEYAEDHLALTAFVRWSEYSKKQDRPVIIFSAVWTQPRFLAAKDSGATALMILPMPFHSLFRRFMSVQVSDRVFINGDYYRGPDRRMKSNPAFAGPYRRSRDRSVLKDPNYVEPVKQRPVPPVPPQSYSGVGQQSDLYAALKKT